jgi:hypothetical protein
VGVDLDQFAPQFLVGRRRMGREPRKQRDEPLALVGIAGGLESTMGRAARTGLTGRARPAVELVEGVEAAREW